MAVPIGAEALSHLIVSWMLVLSPPERDAVRVTYPEAAETVSERRSRYDSIADDVAAAVEEVAPYRRRGAAELLVAIAWHESGFAKDVDVGPCAPGRLKIGGCDRGRARGLWQLQGRSVEETKTRSAAARVALHVAYVSLAACKKLPFEDRLAVYASGTCDNKMGQRRSREIWSILKRIRTMKDGGHERILGER